MQNNVYLREIAKNLVYFESHKDFKLAIDIYSSIFSRILKDKFNKEKFTRECEEKRAFHINRLK